MDKKNNIQFCMLVSDLKNAAAGICNDKDAIIAQLLQLDGGITGHESTDYRILDKLRKSEGEGFRGVCSDILTLVAGSRPERYDLLGAFAHDHLVQKRLELARLQKTVERLENIEKFKELKELREEGTLDSDMERDYMYLGRELGFINPDDPYFGRHDDEDD